MSTAQDLAEDVQPLTVMKAAHEVSSNVIAPLFVPYGRSSWLLVFQVEMLTEQRKILKLTSPRQDCSSTYAGLDYFWFG